MKIHEIDMRIAVAALALLGCPKTAGPSAGAAGGEDAPSNATVPSEREDAPAGGTMQDPERTETDGENPGEPDEPESTPSNPEDDKTPPEPPVVTWQGVRQDGLDVDHTIDSVDVDATGAVFIGGSVRGPFAGTEYESWRLLVASYGADGALAWTWERDDLTGRGHVSSVSGDGRGNVYFVGQTGTALGSDPVSGERDAFAGKLDAAGNLLWVKSIGTPSFDEAEASAVDTAGNLVLAGYAGGALVDQREQEAGAAGFITKLSAEGSHVWTRRQGGRFIDLSSGANGTVYVGEEGPSVLALDSAGNTLWTSDIDEQSEIGDDLDDPEGGYSGDLLGPSTAADRDGATLFVAGGYGGVGFQSVVYGYVGRLDPMTGELSWIAGLDSDVTGIAAAPDGSRVYVTTLYDCVAFDATGAELWRVPMLSGDALSAGVAGDLFLAGTTLFSNITGTPGSGISGARDWIVARVRQSDGALL